jgi:hypothetical protein
MTVQDPEYSPSPYAHAVRHLDTAEEYTDAVKRVSMENAMVNALIGIGWALLAIASKR